jgi:hypothetical protein
MANVFNLAPASIVQNQKGSASAASFSELEVKAIDDISQQFQSFQREVNTRRDIEGFPSVLIEQFGIHVEALCKSKGYPFAFDSNLNVLQDTMMLIKETFSTIENKYVNVAERVIATVRQHREIRTAHAAANIVAPNAGLSTMGMGKAPEDAGEVPEGVARKAAAPPVMNAAGSPVSNVPIAAVNAGSFVAASRKRPC